MGEVKKVAVKIQGKEYRINCVETEAYIEKITYYLDKKLDEAKNSNPSLDSLTATTLVALNLVDSLFKAVKTMERISGNNGIKSRSSVYREIERLDKEGVPK